jgi:hypothetical protein
LFWCIWCQHCEHNLKKTHLKSCLIFKQKNNKNHNKIKIPL